MPEHSSPRFQVCGPRRRSPPPAARVVASLLLVVAPPLACTRAGDGAPASRDSALAASPRPGAASAASAAATSPLADSVAAADARFQAARAAVNRDAQALDARSAQRHTRDYANAYDELRRRTLAAESLRADRDALRKRLRRAEGSASGPR